MRHLVFFLIIIYTIYQPINSYAQLRVSYELNSNIGTQHYFQKEQIYSDFGRRRGGDTEWHRGVDYDHGNEQTIDAVLSINTGDIINIRGNGTYKFVVVEGEDNNNFGYGHIFTNAIPQPGQGIQCGDMVLYQLDNNNNGEFVIIDLNLVNHDAYGRSGLVGVQFEYETITYTIRNDIFQNDPVGIMGSSGMTNPRIHLHLYLFDDPQIPFQQNQGWDNVTNDYNPLSVINYKNDPGNQNENFTEYDVNIIWNDDNWNNEQRSVMNHSGEDESSICVRVAMQNETYGTASNHYDNDVMDISNVKLFIRPSYEPNEEPPNWGVSNSNYKLIVGPWYRSEIDLGAIIGHNKYPTNLHNAEGDLNTTGIYPWAYHDTEGYPYDDYHFSDFFTRIHKDDNQSNGTNFQRALNNDQARYPDGNYNLYAKAVSVKEDGNGDYTFTSPPNDPTTINIDNFLPFIEKVEIIRTNDDYSQEIVYGRKWNWMDTYYQLGATTQGDIFLNDQLTLKITCSESMEELSAEVGLISNIDLTNNDDKTIWTGDLSDISLGEIKISIDGTDINVNDLQDGGDPLCIRESETQWSDTPHPGTDENHSFIVNEPSPVDFIFHQNSYHNLRVDFFAQIEAGIQVNSYYWEFGDGSTSAVENPAKQYTVSGIYTVILNIESTSGSYSRSKLVIVEDLTLPKANFLKQIEFNNYKGRDETATISFFDDSEGVIGEWIWDLNGNIYPYTDPYNHNPPDQTIPIGTNFDVKLTVNNVLGEDEKLEIIECDPTISPFVYITAWETSYSSREFIVDVRNLTSPYNYRIEYGDGTSEIKNSELFSWYEFEHEYFSQGDYIVTIYIEDVNGNEVSNSTEVSIQFWNLDINAYCNSETTPIYPYIPVNLQATSNPSCESYSYNWYVYNIEDPNFLLTNTGFMEADIGFSDVLFPEAGTYRTQVFVTNGEIGEVGMGTGDLTIEVENAPDYINAKIIGDDPISVGLNSIQTFWVSNESGPIGSPGIPDDEWHPTNTRWTILRYDEASGEEIIFDGPFEKSFSYKDYLFEQNRYATFNFNGWEEGEYILRFEYWNGTHQYESNGYLHPKYEHSICFYDYDEKIINVTNDYATLVLNQPPINDNELIFYADGGVSEIQISNPGNKKVIWNTEISYLTEEVDWIEIQNPIGTNLNNLNSPTSINIEILQKDDIGKRNAIIYIHAQLQDQNANPDLLINNLVVIHINQYGIDGPYIQYIYPNNSFEGQRFGYSSSIHNDIIVIGAPGEDNDSNGSAFVFYKNDIGYWEQIAKLIPSSIDNRNLFGNDVDIYNDILVVGVPQYADWPGCIKIYNRNLNSSNNWGLVETLCTSNLGFPFIYYNAKLGKTVSIFDNYITSAFYRPVIGDWTHDLYSIRYELGESDWENLSYYDHEYNFVWLNYEDWSANNYVESSAIYINSENEMMPIHGYPLAYDYNKPGIGAIWYHTLPCLSKFTWDNDYAYGGQSVLGNYRYYGVGLPGKDDCGSVWVDNKPHEQGGEDRPEYKSLCEASLDLTLINYEILSGGTYPLVEAKKLTLGGEGYPAIIRDGAEINYEGKEVIMLPGFEAEDGSLVEINAYDCEPQMPPDMKADDYYASNSNYNCGDCDRLDEKNNLLEVNLIDVFAHMKKEYSDYPWYTINILEDINKIELINNEYKVISKIENPHPEKCCFNKERSINEDLYLLIYINNKIFNVKI